MHTCVRPSVGHLQLMMMEHQNTRDALPAGGLYTLVDAHKFGLGQIVQPAPTDIDWTPCLRIHPQMRAGPAQQIMAQEVSNVPQRHQDLRSHMFTSCRLPESAPSLACWFATC